MSWTPLVSPGTRFVACDSKATRWALLLRATAKLPAFAGVPSLARLTHVVAPVARSWTKMCRWPSAQRPSRFVASDWKPMKRPLALMAQFRLPAFAWAPLLATLARVVVAVKRSRTKTSLTPFVSPGTRFVAADVNATKRPLALSAGLPLPQSRLWDVVQAFAWAPAAPTLTRLVVPVERS